MFVQEAPDPPFPLLSDIARADSLGVPARGWELTTPPSCLIPVVRGAPRPLPVTCPSGLGKLLRLKVPQGPRAASVPGCRYLTSVPTLSATHTGNHRERARALVMQNQKPRRPERGPPWGPGRATGQSRPPMPGTQRRRARERAGGEGAPAVPWFPVLRIKRLRLKGQQMSSGRPGLG